MILRWLSLNLLLGLLVCSFVGCGPECPIGQRKCGETKQTSTCVNTDINRKHCGACGTACRAGEVCSLGKCSTSCQEGLTLCEGRCANTKLDTTHCGRCNRVCKAGELCQNGVCTISCPAKQIACNGSCVNIQTSTSHCGKCGTVCAQGETCNTGKCELSCPKSQTVCANSCIDTSANRDHCGTCNNKCKQGQVCNTGKCTESCQADLTNCSGVCVNPKSDSTNCGACGVKCDAGQRCQSGKCELSCGKGYKVCKGACINTQVSRKHCGKCDTACEAGQICTSGQCELSCPKNLTNCSGKCIDTQSNQAHCGACSTAKQSSACQKGEVCQSGKCELFCQTGFTNCKGACVNLQTDTKNCGVCQTTCKPGEGCLGGKCVSTVRCLAEETVCGGKCATLSQDVANCGQCGTLCKTEEICLQGRCKVCRDCASWAIHVGAFNSDYFEGVTVDSKDNIYAVGRFHTALSLGKTILNSNGGDDILVVKMTPNGKVLWAKHAGGITPDSGYAIAVDNAGNAYVTGSIQGTATFGSTKLTTAGGGDIFVAKLSSSGVWLWAKNYGSSSSDYGYSIAVDPLGNSYVTGRFYSTIKLGSVTLTSKGGGDIFVAKWDKDGTVVWAGSTGSPSTEEGEGIAIDKANNIYVTGRFYQSITWGTTTLSSRGSSDVFVAKYNSAGVLQWASSAGGASADYGLGIATDNNGNVAVTGRTYLNSTGATFGTTTLQGKSNTEIFVAQLDKTGRWTWAVSAGGPSTDYGHGVGFDKAGNVYATGYFHKEGTFGKTKLQASGFNSQMFLMQVDKQGTIIGAIQTGGRSTVRAYDLAIDSKDNILIAGSGTGILHFGEIKLVMNGGSDAFVAKYPKPVSVLCPQKGFTVCSRSCTQSDNDPKNCGTCGTVCKTGDICFAGKCTETPKNIIISEINVGAPDYVVLKNRGTTDTNLGGLVLRMNGSTSFNTTPDINYTIPSFTLKAGASVYLVEFSSKTGELNPGSIPYTRFSNFAAMLCFGQCSENNGANVIDAMVVGAKRPLPKGITVTGDFTPRMTSFSQETADSYIHSGTQGKNPTFHKADWKIAKKTRP